MVKLGKYYPDLIWKTDRFFLEDRFLERKIGDDGVIFAYIKRPNVGKQYHPTIIAHYAFSSYNEYVETAKETYKEVFLRQSNWLLENFEDKGEFGVWLAKWPLTHPGYKCTPPWCSALMQGHGIATMIRAHSLTNNNQYLNVAKKALNAFNIPVSKGGVLSVDDNGDYWYEEYACKKMGTPLNGFIYALLGIYEFYQYLNNKVAKIIFNRGVDTLRKHLSNYELNLGFFKWTRYDNKLMIHGGRTYHDLHIKQVNILYNITQKKEFLEHVEKWKDWRKRYKRIQRPLQLICVLRSMIISRLGCGE